MVDNTVDLKDGTARDNIVLAGGIGEDASRLVFLNLVSAVKNNGRDHFLDIGKITQTLGQFAQVIDPNTTISGK